MNAVPAFNLFGGMTFWISGEDHLWFVLSDPDQNDRQVIYANLTSYSPAKGAGPYNDPACLIYQGDHPFIRNLTCVNYYCAQDASVYNLTRKFDQGRIKVCDDPFSATLLQSARAGAEVSDFIRIDHQQILRNQSIA